MQHVFAEWFLETVPLVSRETEWQNVGCLSSSELNLKHWNNSTKKERNQFYIFWTQKDTTVSELFL